MVVIQIYELSNILYKYHILTMSISAGSQYKMVYESAQPLRDRRIMSEILSLFSDSRLKGKIAIPVLDLNTIQIIFLTFKQSVKVTFNQNFPHQAPKFSKEKSLFESLVTQSGSLDSWSSQSQLSDVVADVYQNMQRYSQNQMENKGEKNGNSLENIHVDDYRRKDSKDSSEEGGKRKVMMNGCADNQLTETKNLNRHFRSKLREVFFDVVKDGFQAPEDARWIQNSFTLPRVGFEDIAKVLKNQWFNIEVNKQMENGKFMHKIMKGMMSIKSKKLMVKYYHVMLAAAKDPENFVKWKYQ